MKGRNNKLVLGGILAAVATIYACSKSFLDRPITGPTLQTNLANKAGVNGLLIGAYSLLDGVGAAGTTGVPALIAPDGSGGVWEGSADNWIYGSVPGGDDHKGSTVQDQGTYFLPIQSYSTDPSNLFIEDKWIILYASINRCNVTLQTMALVTDGSMSPEDTTQVRAEARFLRGIYTLEAKKMWKNIPYVDETVSIANANYNVPNTIDAWPMIEADFQYAIDNLPATQSQVGRGNSWAAKAFLAKCYMFEQKYAEAKTLLADVIANGVTQKGVKYALLPRYGDNFNAAFKNNSEAVFSAQESVNDNAGGQNGNGGDVLNFPYGGPTTCCGFNQPSYSLANSFKVDAVTGLPLLDTYNNSDIKSDEGIKTWVYTTTTDGLINNKDTFKTEQGTLDPRIDWSIGRRGIPYLDWGLPPGASWIREQQTAGPYSPIKQVVTKAQQGVLSQAYGGWASNQATANNYVYIRFADVLLWAAECEAQVGTLGDATDYVNKVRMRLQDPSTWVHEYKKNALGFQDPTEGESNIPAANYKVGLYPAFADQATALKAIYFERKLELSSEGHRFFDLVRWGIANDEITKYIDHEVNYDHAFGPEFGIDPATNKPFRIGCATLGGFLNGVFSPIATFTPGKSEYYPIPQRQMDASKVNGVSSLTQNPGY